MMEVFFSCPVTYDQDQKVSNFEDQQFYQSLITRVTFDYVDQKYLRTDNLRNILEKVGS